MNTTLSLQTDSKVLTMLTAHVSQHGHAAGHSEAVTAATSFAWSFDTLTML